MGVFGHKPMKLRNYLLQTMRNDIIESVLNGSDTIFLYEFYVGISATIFISRKR